MAVQPLRENIQQVDAQQFLLVSGFTVEKLIIRAPLPLIFKQNLSSLASGVTKQQSMVFRPVALLPVLEENCTISPLLAFI